MIPIHQLLDRIRWDAEFGSGNFELGYLDRVENRILIVPLRGIEFLKDNREMFRLIDAEGLVHNIPFHRVRHVYKDGRLIWHRPDGEKKS
jgi:uncharacterized protein (UPF0248 family)